MTERTRSVRARTELRPEEAFAVARRRFRRQQVARRLAVGGLSAIVLAGAVAVSISRKSNAPTHTPPATVSTTSPTQNANLRDAAAQLDQMLVDANEGFMNLNQNALAPFINCTMSGSEAADRMTSVISNRQNIVNTVNARHDTDPTVKRLVATFVHAMELSLDADYSYQSWARANPGTLCPRTVTPDKVKADSIGDNATTAKRAFAAEFNPIAAQYGLRADWTAAF